MHVRTLITSYKKDFVIYSRDCPFGEFFNYFESADSQFNHTLEDAKNCKHSIGSDSEIAGGLRISNLLLQSPVTGILADLVILTFH